MLQHGKVVKTLELRKAITKGKKTRQIPLNLEARETIETLMEWKKSYGEQMEPASPLFCSLKKSGRLTRIQAHRILKKAYDDNELTGKVTTHRMRKSFTDRKRWIKGLCKKAEVKSFGFHAIRHLTASILAQNNIPMVQIQAILRHKKLSTTEIYLHRISDLRPVLKVLSIKKDFQPVLPKSLKQNRESA